ncbi:hypothetical protein FA132_35225, partial [Pseudomonas aeruginosa]|nr:hypothetical protein [Pseudomonas aeruginosa]
GRISVESVVRCSWNGWPDDRGIRMLVEHHGIGLVGDLAHAKPSLSRRCTKVRILRLRWVVRLRLLRNSTIGRAWR